MEKMVENKFQELSVEELQQVEGGKKYYIIYLGELIVVEN
ncbi:MAG: bacteriocin [Dysgonomonas sp.]|nr:bacteriocin [Dysgonomonas sp.]